MGRPSRNKKKNKAKTSTSSIPGAMPAETETVETKTVVLSPTNDVHSTNHGDAVASSRDTGMVVALIHELKADMANMKLDIKELEKENKELKWENKQLKWEVSKLKNEVVDIRERQNCMITALKPKIDVALMEDAVCKSVDNSDRVKYAVAAACIHVLWAFATGSVKCCQNQKWKGPDPVGSKKRLVALIQALDGLQGFVQRSSTFLLKNWEPTKRHEVAHNGPLLNAVFPSPTSVSSVLEDYDELKNNVLAFRLFFDLHSKEAPKSDHLRRFSNYALTKKLENKMSNVVTTLRGKGLTICPELHQAALEMFKNLCVH